MNLQAPGFEGERRQVTAVFVDLQDFSAVASVWDAEELQTWLDDYYRRTREIFVAAGGVVTEYLGDGVVAVFGLHRADEHSAARAVDAALRVVATVQPKDRQGAALGLRAGVATGDAAVRAVADPDGLPRLTGAVTLLAERLQSVAGPGEVVISEPTQRLLRGQFVTRPLPAQPLKGFPGAMPLHQAIGRSVAPGLVLPRAFVGRDRELALLEASSAPVLIVGTAGIGKSALVAKHATGLSGPVAARTLVLQGTPLARSRSYQPFRDWLLADMAPHRPEFAVLNRAHPLLAPEDIHALALVLGLPEGQRLTLTYRGGVLARRIETALWRALRSRQQAGLLVFEDVHWFDAASLGVLAHVCGSPLADMFRIVLTSRVAQLPGLTDVTGGLQRLELDPLPQDAVTHLLRTLAPTGLPADQLRRIAERADGVPLFAEQLLQHCAADGQGLPASLTDLLGERIDRTGAARPVLQRASALGRGFTSDMLRALDPEEADPAPHLLAAAQAGVLVTRPDGTWDFAHALLAQAAYQSMLRSKSQALHARIAALIQQQDVRFLGRDVGLLADHQRIAGQTHAALRSYLDVSKSMMLQGAVTDAETLARQALRLCGDLPASQLPEAEIAVHTALGTVLSQRHGYAAEPVRQEFQVVLDIATSQSALSIDTAPALFGSISQAVISGDLVRAERLCLLLDGIAAGAADPAAGLPGREARFAALTARMFLGFFRGDLADPAPNLRMLRALGLLDKADHMASRFGMDLIGTALEFAAATRALRGEAAAAIDLVHETDRHVLSLDLPVMKPCVLIWGAVPLFHAGERDRALDRLAQGLAAAQDQGAVFWQVVGRAWTYVMDPALARSPGGLADFAQTIAAVREVGAEVAVPYFRAHLADFLAEAGQTAAALGLSDWSVTAARQAGVLCWLPEILRLHARVCRAARRLDATALAEAEAVDLASSLGAGHWLDKIARSKLPTDRHAPHRARGARPDRLLARKTAT
jgi:class 3 adenylate cyclase